MISFKLSKEGRAYVPVHIKPCDEKTLQNISFKIDTGADLTTISKKELHTIGYSMEWINKNAVKDVKHTLTRAGGKKETAWYIVIPISNFSGCDMKNWTFYIRVEKDRDYPNLLGLDVLSNFNFTFNYDMGILSVEPAKKPVIVFPKLINQDISSISVKNELQI